MREIIKRQLLIIQLLLKGSYVSTKQIQEYLSEFGIDTKLRTLQRDLVTLEELLPIECRKDDKPYSWRWQRLDNTVHNQLSLSQAIALRLVETELQGVIPNDLYERLQPLFVKSHLVTGLSQLEGFEEINSNEVETKKSRQREQFSTIKTNIAPFSPIQRLIITLRAKQAQLKSNTKKFAVESPKSDSEESFSKIDETDQLAIKDLKGNLLARDLQSIADLLD